MTDKEWIGIDSLEQIKASGNDKVIVLLEAKDGYRKITIPCMTTMGRWWICEDPKDWKIIAYYVIQTMSFCCFSPSHQHSTPELQGKGMALALWGWSYLAKTSMQLCEFKEGYFIYSSLYPPVQPPDHLLGWSILPDIYNFKTK